VFDLLELKKCEKFISRLISYFYTIHNELNFDLKIDLSTAEDIIDLEQKRVTVFCLLLYMTNIIMMNSIHLCVQFSLNGFLKAYFQFLSDKDFLEKNSKKIFNMWSREANPINYMVMNVLALSKACDENKSIWVDLGSINILLKVCQLKESTQKDGYLAIINIADDKQIESLIEMKTVKNSILSELEKTVQNFNADLFSRYNRQIQFQGKTINCSVHCIAQVNQTTMSIIVILRGLYKLSINEKMKNQLYFEDALKSRLKVIILKGNFFEIFFALEIIAQFSFDKKLAIDLAQDVELDSKLRLLNQKNADEIKDENEKGIYKGIKKFIEQIDWNLNKKVVDKETGQKDHVMISYNTANRDLCLKIKEHLELIGLKVWIDVDDIHGSSLDAMAKAVENSFCVLMCVTEKYRQSVNCQAEAQYAFKLNKKIIPLILQSGYENVQGWLGIIIGDKIFVNFTKYELNECFKRLKKEIKKCMENDFVDLKEGINVSNIQLNESNTHLIVSNKARIDVAEKWTENDVKEWFVKNNLNMAILENLMPCSGIVLEQIYIMRLNAPQFFYQSLKEIPNVNLSSISLFAHYLVKLFEKN
jgi:hypothetical protein